MSSRVLLFMISVWLLYFSGQFFHVLLRAWAAMNSKLNGIESYEQFFKTHAVPILVRLFLGVLGMLLWFSVPELFSQPIKALASLAHIDVGARPLPLNPATAGVFGYFLDSLLDKLALMVPALRREIPPVNGQPDAGGGEPSPVDTGPRPPREPKAPPTV